MKNHYFKTLIFLLCQILANFGLAQSYVTLSDASGFDSSPYIGILNQSATELQDAIPSSQNLSFKIIEFGYYLHSASTVEGTEPIWNLAISQADAINPYYLLIGKESSYEGLFNRFRVRLKMPQTGMFECMDPIKRTVIEQQIELAINQKYAQLGSSPYNYAQAEIVGIETLKGYFDTYSSCCMNGVYSSNCDQCTFTNDEIASYLSSSGFAEYKDATVSIESQAYSGNLVSPIMINVTIGGHIVPLTDELEWFLGQASAYGTAQAKVSLFNSGNCDSFSDYAPLSVGNNVYTEDLVVVDKGGETRLFYRISENLSGNPALKPGDPNEKRAALPVVAVWLLKRAAMAGVGVMTHIGTELIFEKWFGDYVDWGDAWDAVDLDWLEVVQAGVEGAIGADAAKIQIFVAVFTQAVDYTLETDGDQITWEGVFSNALLGGVQGLINIYADELMGSFTKRLDKYGPKLAHQSLEKLGIKDLFFEIKSFRKTFIGILWDSPTDDLTRGKLIEEVLKFNTFKQADGWQWVGPLNGPTDYVHNAGWTSQVKSIAKINPAKDWTNMQKSVNKACDQLIASLNDYPGNSLRMDIPIPAGQLGYKNQALNKIRQHIQNHPTYGPNARIQAMLSSNNIFIGTYSN